MFKMPEIKVDPRPFNKVSATCNQAADSGENLVLKSQLSTYKIKTVGGSKLPKEDIPVVKELVTKMKSKYLLTEKDKLWCKENGVII